MPKANRRFWAAKLAANRARDARAARALAAAGWRALVVWEHSTRGPALARETARVARAVRAAR